ncbi:MAG: altronate dehydratase [Chloroflexi bacterium]|nr:altronate dehydratase [Chloroflexota bacterium]
MHISFQETAIIHLHPDDNLVIALIPLSPGRALSIGTLVVKTTSAINAGHKVAIRQIRAGEVVRRYGQIIGFAQKDIHPGDHIHTHNLSVGSMQLDYAVASDTKPVPYVPTTERRSFMGYKRADGSVGTRNTVAVIGTVNCSSHTLKRIVARAKAELLPRYPNVTDIVALAHKHGCATRDGSPELGMLQRTLAGFAHNANVAGYLFVGLGCETNQFESLFNAHRARFGSMNLPPYLAVQDEGGVTSTIEAGLHALQPILAHANTFVRTNQSVEHINLALQCGGSDGFSGISANPALGYAVDMLVAQGGTAVLSETPEIYGAEHMLTRRASNHAVADKLISRIHWWEEYTRTHGFEIDNNPSHGNKAGGLTTIYEKSLGAVAKGGSMPLTAVYEYAELITERGFVFMDTPGYDPVSATGQVAGGSNMIVFTTGRGSCFGFKPVPSIKISTNTTTYERMRSDMDINAGTIITGEETIAQVGKRIFEYMIEVASGKHSLSEAQDIGEEEFNPWMLGATM